MSDLFIPPPPLPRVDTPDSLLFAYSSMRDRTACISSSESLQSSFSNQNGPIKSRNKRESALSSLVPTDHDESTTFTANEQCSANASFDESQVYPAPPHFVNALAELPDDVHVSTLMKKLGQKHEWTSTEVLHDINTLEKQRIRTVFHLRYLSLQSWQSLGLLPIVKDIIRIAIWETVKRSPGSRSK